MKRCIVLVASVLCGCALLVEKGDYADYRAVRLAHDEPARLRAMQTYVAQHPEGHYYEEVQSARAKRELATYENGKGTRAGLEHYLAVFPDGAFASQARSRLSSIDVIEQQRAREREHAAELLAQRKLRDAELRRTWVTRFVGYWSKTLLGLSSWGASIPDVAQANPVFSRAFGAEPRPRCTQDECVKYYQSPFAVPQPGGTRVERTLSLLLRLRMREGKLQRAELLLPAHGFSRWYELEQRKVVVDADPEARNAAVTWALAALMPAITELGEGVVSASKYEHSAIEKSAIGPSGEITDTSAEDPSAPPNRLSGTETQSASTAAKPADVSELIKPKEAEPAADMVFAPVQIDKSGRALAVPQAAARSDEAKPAAGAVQSPAASGGEMIMAPMVIGKEGTAAPAPALSASPSPSTEPAPASPARIDVAPSAAKSLAFEWKGLRIVLHAAASDAPEPAYDGVIIERAASAGGTETKSGKPKSLPPKRH